MSETTFTVADLRVRLYALDAKIAKARTAVDRAARELETLQAQRAGAEAFLALLSEPAPVTRTKVANGGISDVVVGIMGEHPEGIANAEIRRIAAERGHDFDAEQVRSAVTYLSRRGDAIQVERGVWRLKNSAPANENGPDSPGPFTLSALPSAVEVQTG